MNSPARGGGGLAPKALALAVGLWAVAGSSIPVHAGGPGRGPFSFWGDFGRGPTFGNRGCHYNDFGPPYFTHPMGPGCSYFATGYPRSGTPSGFSAGDPAYGPYTGAPPYPSTVAPSFAPAERADVTPPRRSRLDADRIRSAVKAAEDAEADEAEERRMGRPDPKS